MSEPAAAARLRLRLARETDAEAVLAIYRPVVEHTHVSFELEPPDLEEMRRRIGAYGAFAPYLVCEAVCEAVCEEFDEAQGVEPGALLGFAYAAPFRPRRAYRFSVETSVYVAEAARRRGVALRLYRALIGCLRAQGFVTAVAGIALPNDPSVALHERLGFRRAARLPAIGFKQGRWIDVGWWRLALRDPPDAPAEPLAPEAIPRLDELLGG